MRQLLLALLLVCTAVTGALPDLVTYEGGARPLTSWQDNGKTQGSSRTTGELEELDATRRTSQRERPDFGLKLSSALPKTGSWDNMSDWRVLPQPRRSCSDYAGAYVSILSGEAAIEQALCVHRQLNRWGATCPYLVFHDDQPGYELSPAAVGRLKSALGPAHVRPASALYEQTNITRGMRENVTRTIRRSAHSTAGRRLLQGSAEKRYMFFGTVTKVCLLMLEGYQRIVFLDLDVVLLEPLDALIAMQMPLTTYFAGVGLGGHCPFALRSNEPFNFGVGVLKPSKRLFTGLMRRLCWWFDYRHQDPQFRALFGSACATFYPAGGPTKVKGNVQTFSKVCEKGRTDQSLFNQQIRGNYMRLPYGYNAIPTRWRKPPPVRNASAVAVMHFTGDPKPWATLSARKAAANPIHAISSKLWKEACAPLAVNPIETSLRINVLASQLLGRRWV